MPTRKKKKRDNGNIWKLIALVLFIALGFCIYIIFNGNSNKDIRFLEGSIKNTFKKVDEIKDDIADELAYQTENTIKPAIEDFKSKSNIPDNNTSSNNGSNNSLNLKLELPVNAIKKTDEIIIRREGYTLSYNNFYKNPNWVAWELTREETKGKEDRYDKFLPDPELPEPRVVHSDYTRSGYDRGHMAPAADMKWSEKAMKESFYMSNICPQVGNLNRGDWNDLEELCRDWAEKYGTLYIACGPIFDSKTPKRIGKNKVGVPDKFFKVVLVYNMKNPIAMGFIFKNESKSQDIKKYMVTVDSIENITGMDFFSKLPDDVENRIEATIPKLPTK